MQIAGIDIRDVAACTCQRLRRASRRVTQIYEHHLDPSDLTIGQFGVLGHLFGAQAMARAGLAMGDLADRLGVDPTTLKRTLGPLVTNGLVETRADDADRRVKLIRMTDAGRERLEKAIPRWRQAQTELRDVIGTEVKDDLNRVTDEVFARIARHHIDAGASPPRKRQ